MRLIKLSTINDEAVFTANFDTDILLKENAQVALKNISFEINAGIFAATVSTAEIDASPIVEDGTHSFTAIVEPGIYKDIDSKKFLRKLNNALNRNITLKNSEVNTQTDDAIFSQYLVYIGSDGKTKIEYRVSPQLNALEADYAGGNYLIDPLDRLYRPPTHFSNFTVGGFNAVNNEIIGVKNTLPIEDDHIYHITTPHSIGLCKGGGVFYAQISKSIVGGDITKEGFGMGIALHRVDGPYHFFDPTDFNTGSDPRDLQAGRMSDASRSMEIEFRNSNNNYRFIDKGLFESKGDTDFQDAGFSSQYQGLNNDDNDIIVFEIDAEDNNTKVVRGSVIQMVTGTATKRTLFTRVLTETEQEIYNLDTPQDDLNSVKGIDLVPYIYFRGNIDTIQLKHLRMTLDPFMRPPQLGGTPIFVDHDSFQDFALPITDSDPRVGGGALSASNVAALLPRLDVTAGPSTRFRKILGTPLNSKLVLSRQLSDQLGGAPNGKNHAYNVTQEIGLTPAGVYGPIPGDPQSDYGIAQSIFTFSDVMKFAFEDLFIVETKSFELESYDSSAIAGTNPQGDAIANTSGNRKNILAVVLHNGTESLVQHEPNELNFIDVKNTSSVNLRNLRLRIVDDNFNKISVSGKSHMTLLIKD